MAAVLACGNGAVLSHRSAAALWSVGPYTIDGDPIDVTVVGPRRGCRPGIRAHHVRSLEGDEVTTLQRIPITAPARTLLDLARVASARELEAAVAEAERRYLTTERELLALFARHRARRGTRALRHLLDRGTRPALTRSEAEKRCLGLIRRARLDPPEVNVRLGPYEVDFLWREQRLVVEVDGFAYHSDRAAFERDRRRDADLAALGYTVVRVTWRQLVDEPAAVVARVAQALARSGARGSARYA
jgi:very-short-patch-repair endonuclease